MYITWTESINRSHYTLPITKAQSTFFLFLFSNICSVKFVCIYLQYNGMYTHLLFHRREIFKTINVKFLIAS